MPTAGLDWIREVLAVHGKLIGGTGIIYYGPDGWFRKENNRGVQLLGDICPALFDILKKQYTGSRPWYQTLSWRAKAFRSGEYLRFSRPEFAPSVEMVQDAVYNNKSLYLEQIREVHEQEVILKHGDGPGLYICGELDLERIRIGHSKEVATRDMDGHYHIDRIIATPDTRAAKDLEDLVLRELRVHSLLLDPYRQSKSKFIFQPGTNALEVVNRITNAKDFFGRRFFNRNKINESSGVVKKLRFRVRAKGESL